MARVSMAPGNATSIVLKSAELAEAPAIADLHAALFSKAWTVADIESLLDLPTTHALVALENLMIDGCRPGSTARTVSGFVLARSVVPEAEILAIGVARSFQSRGVGNALLARLEAVLSASGVETVHLEAAADNWPALALYARRDYRVSGLRRGYYPRADGPSVDAVLHAKSI